MVDARKEVEKGQHKSKVFGSRISHSHDADVSFLTSVKEGVLLWSCVEGLQMAAESSVSMRYYFVTSIACSL